jgi:hypothetical protein
MNTPRNLTITLLITALFVFGAAVFCIAADAIREVRLKQKLGKDYEGPAAE